jgi:SAM-dependent methyltransferase
MGKPTADIYVDDKATNVSDWLSAQSSSLPAAVSALSTDTSQATPDYLELTYSEDRLPPSDYPSLLSAWLMQNAFRRTGSLLDVGCGRGDYLKTFASLGFEVTGVDSAPSAREMAPGIPVKVANIEEGLPFADASFDYIFSKSNIEHLQQPGRMLHECFLVIRPGGLAVVMTPSWRHQWRVFYEDYTHVSPFTLNGLTDALTLAGFSGVEVRLFWQLPFLWKRPWLFPLTRGLALLPLRYRPWDRAPWPESINKLIRFSKEVMLLGLARKAAAE